MPYQLVVGLGNPGNPYNGTRHNIGFAVVDLLRSTVESLARRSSSAHSALASCGVTEALSACSDEAKGLVRSAVTGALDDLAWSSRDGLFESRIECGSWSGHLLKPRTFMNRSGEPLGALMRFRKVPIGDVVVVHDEIDLPFGAVRVKSGGGEGGHNGLRSISELCGGRGYTRIRVGVGKPPPSSEMALRDDGIATWVLKRFTGEELDVAEATVLKGMGALLSVLWEGITKAQNRWN